MSINQQIILQTLVEQKHQEIAPEKKLTDFFNIFSIEQILKDYDLSYEEVEVGITDGGNDGGIDAIYTLVNGELIQTPTDLVDVKRNGAIDLIIFQSKFSSGFTESAIEKFNSSALDLLDFSKDIDSLRTVYSELTIKYFKIFREQYKKIISKLPRLRVKYFYVTKGIEVHPNVVRKTEILKKTIKQLFSDAELSFEFFTAQRLLDLSRKEQTHIKDLVLEDNPISTQDGAYVAIVNLKSFYDFITDDKLDLIKYFFDANVRDYEGSVEVNEAIQETLENPGQEDFWWLNNGITITATKAIYSSKSLTIEDPQIVNGLQSSFEIYHFFKKRNPENETRNVLIRVIPPKTESSRLKVIRATNSQTKVSLASLRATDLIHRDIEDYLSNKGYYYDRRKNFHKNAGRPISKIISIAYLGQAVMSIVLREPDYARARPSTFLKNDEQYKKIFNPDYPISIYYNCVKIQNLVSEALKSDKYNYKAPQIGDVKFYISRYLISLIAQKAKPKVDEISSIDIDNINSDLIDKAIEEVFVLYDSLGGTDAVAKGKDLIVELNELITEELMHSSNTSTPIAD